MKYKLARFNDGNIQMASFCVSLKAPRFDYVIVDRQSNKNVIQSLNLNKSIVSSQKSRVFSNFS